LPHLRIVGRVAAAAARTTSTATLRLGVRALAKRPVLVGETRVVGPQRLVLTSPETQRRFDVIGTEGVVVDRVGSHDPEESSIHVGTQGLAQGPFETSHVLANPRGARRRTRCSDARSHASLRRRWRATG